MNDSDDSLTEPDWTEPEWSAPDRQPTRRRSRRDRLGPVEPVRGRTAAVVGVIATILLVGVVGAAAGTPEPAPAPSAAGGVAVSPAGAYSSSVFCAAGTGTAATSTVYLTNSTPAAVEGAMTAIEPAGAGGGVPVVHRGVTVPALGTVAVNPGAGLPAGSTAATFAFSGGGVVATQVVSGPNGWSTAPCASRIASQWLFAGGATTTGNTLTLSLFNPSSTEAVVNVSFVTDQGFQAPQQYQGLVVPSGQVLEENVGDFVQDAAAVATMVEVQAGGVVSSEFQQWSSGSSGGLSLRLGSPALSTTWRLAQTTSLARSTVDLFLANPGQVPATATIDVGLSTGSVVPHRVVVPPVSVAAFAASATPGFPEQTPYALTVTATAPIVVGRAVEAPPGSTPPAWGSSSATSSLAARWLVPAPGVPGTPGTPGASVSSLAVANPGTAAAQVEVSVFGTGRPVAMFTVPPRAVEVLGPKQVGGLSTFEVSADQPVHVEEDSGPSGAPGVVSSSGFPLDP